MTSEQDPAPEPTAAPPEASAPPAARKRAKKKPQRSKARRAWWAVPPLVLAVGLSIAWLVLFNRPRTHVTPSRPVVAAESILPPPPQAIALAGPAKGEAKVAANCERTLSKMAMIAEALGPDLRSLAAASSEAVALPDQRQAGRAVQLPSYQRWEIRLPPGTTMESYARELDFFGVELGVIGGSKDIVYLSQFSQPKPTRRVAPSRKEHRLYLISQRGAAADQALAIRAGLSLNDRVVAQFYPPDVENKLAELERAYAEEQQNKSIAKTVFGIKPDGDGFVFYVLEQQTDKP